MSDVCRKRTNVQTLCTDMNSNGPWRESVTHWTFRALNSDKETSLGENDIAMSRFTFFLTCLHTFLSFYFAYSRSLLQEFDGAPSSNSPVGSLIGYPLPTCYTMTGGGAFNSTCYPPSTCCGGDRGVCTAPCGDTPCCGAVRTGFLMMLKFLHSN